MNTGKTLFAQLMDFLPWSTFDRIVARYHGNRAVRTFPCAAQYQVMAFAQITYRESLRDLEVLSVSAIGQALSYGFARAGSPLHTGRRQRNSRLADLRRVWPTTDRAGQAVVCRRRSGRGSAQHCLCARLDHDRSMSVDVSLGAFSFDQGSSEDAHATRPAWQHSKFHSHIRRQTARCSCARYAASRTRCHLRHGSGLRGFRPPARAE